MKMLVFSAAVVLGLAGGATALVATADADGETKLRAALVDRNGANVGSAKISFEREDAEVKVEVQLPPSMAGFHGFHIHASGQCVPPFTTAGGHLGEDEGDSAHRHRNHDGDLPVLLVNADGHGSARFETDRIDVAELRDANGAAFIIHAAPDNYANIPARYSNAEAVGVYPGTTTDQATLRTGDAGDRIACGVIE